MKKFLLVSCLTFGLAVASGCTDGGMSQLTSLGSEFKVTVYSGGKVVREFTSTGKVLTEEHSDGWYFKDKATGKLVRISGHVIVEQL